MGDMEILFADSDQINAGQLKINGNYDTISVGSSGDSVDSEVSPEDELEINEQNMDELILTDPLAFEHSLLEESNTDVREARQRQ
jgi:hypothetical protein